MAKSLMRVNSFRKSLLHEALRQSGRNAPAGSIPAPPTMPAIPKSVTRPSVFHAANLRALRANAEPAILLFSKARYPQSKRWISSAESFSRVLENLRGVLKPALAFGLILSLIAPGLLVAEEMSLIENSISGYAKSLNFFTRTSGFMPEFVENPMNLAEPRESLFSAMARIRLKLRTKVNLGEDRRIVLKADYDHQPYFGSFVGSGDFRIAREHIEKRQFLDLGQTLVEDEDAFYEHRLYRASVTYQHEWFDLEIGRQQIPWGVGRFFTPTDLFNPFNPTQIELQERDGVDAVNATVKAFEDFRLQMIYTPPGKDLHPQRYLGRISRDWRGFEVGLLGGRVKRDHALGFDLAGNLGESAVRGEFLYREAELEKDFIKFTLNADYNFPYNIYALLEYHFNGQGRRDPDDYQYDRFIRGDLQQLARNYLALSLGHDLTELLRFECRTILNLDDQSLFLRPELQYEWMRNLLFTLGTQLYFGANTDEYGQPNNLFLGEMMYSF